MNAEVDMVVIGSGIAGPSCAALLARYGFTVTVCESHTIVGGARTPLSVMASSSIQGHMIMRSCMMS